MYSIDITDRAKSQLKKLDHGDQDAILKKLATLKERPFSHLKKLTGTRLWRLRIGKYRAIIDVIIKHERIIVLTIAKRDKAY